MRSTDGLLPSPLRTEHLFILAEPPSKDTRSVIHREVRRLVEKYEEGAESVAMEAVATEEVEVVLGNSSPNYGTASLATSFGIFPFLQRLNLMSETRLVYIPMPIWLFSQSLKLTSLMQIKLL